MENEDIFINVLNFINKFINKLMKFIPLMIIFIFLKLKVLTKAILISFHI